MCRSTRRSRWCRPRRAAVPAADAVTSWWAREPVYGMRIVPLGATERRWTLPEHRLVEGRSRSARSHRPRPRCQLLGTPQWFLGDDWGGNTDLLAGRLAESVPVERATPRTVMLGGRSNATVIDAADPAVDGLAIGLLTEPVDLSPLAGHPGLRWVTSAVGGAIGDLTVLATLPVVEYLHLHITDWRGLFDADAVPTTLLAARVEAHGAADALARSRSPTSC